MSTLTPPCKSVDEVVVVAKSTDKLVLLRVERGTLANSIKNVSRRNQNRFSLGGGGNKSERGMVGGLRSSCCDEMVLVARLQLHHAMTGVQTDDVLAYIMDGVLRGGEGLPRVEKC